jgi:hypothetical protein
VASVFTVWSGYVYLMKGIRQLHMPPVTET